MNKENLYKSIINKVITNDVSLPYVLNEADFDIDLLNEYNIFTEKELEILENYDSIDNTLLTMYFEHPQISTINIEIPDDIDDALYTLKQQGYSNLGICYDIEAENCFDFEADIIINKWINSGTNELEKSAKITSIYKYMLTNPKFN